MKRAELILLFLKLPLDFVAVFFAALAAYYLRFNALTEWRPATEIITFPNYFLISLAFSFVVIFFFALSGLYKKERHSVSEELVKIFFAASAAIALTIFILFFRREFFASRFIIIAVWVLTVFFVGIEKQFFQKIHKILAKKGVIRKNAAIIGKNKEVEIIIEEFKKDAGAGTNIISVFPRFDLSAEEEIEKLSPDELIITDPKISREELERILDFSIIHHISIKYSADIFASGSAKIEVHTIAGIPFVEIKKTPLEGWGRIFKRAFDIAGSLFLIIIFSPLIILTAIGIIFETGFPVIFKNERVGERGKKFDTFKFRSMTKEFSIGKQFKDQDKALKIEQQLITEKGIKEGPVYKIKDDPRVTKFGQILRRWSIDELPQFFNCLIGNMSLVGPRPHQPREVEKYARRHQKIFEIKPGITGLAQISGRSNLEFEDEARLDIFYIENWSPKLDLYILLRTPLAIIIKKGVY